MQPHDTAKGSGTNSTVREIGVALGIAVLTAVFTGAGGELTPTGYVDAAIPAVFVGGAVLLATAIVAMFLPAGAAGAPPTGCDRGTGRRSSRARGGASASASARSGVA